MNKYKFAKAALDENSKIVVVHIVILKASESAMLIHFSCIPLLIAL